MTDHAGALIAGAHPAVTAWTSIRAASATINGRIDASSSVTGTPRWVPLAAGPSVAGTLCSARTKRARSRAPGSIATDDPLKVPPSIHGTTVQCHGYSPPGSPRPTGAGTGRGR